MNEDRIKVQIATTNINTEVEASSTSSAMNRAPRQGSVKLVEVVKHSGSLASLHGVINFSASRKEESLQKLDSYLAE